MCPGTKQKRASPQQLQSRPVTAASVPLAEPQLLPHRPRPMNKAMLQVQGQACVAFREVSQPCGLLICVCLRLLHLNLCYKAVWNERAIPKLPRALPS